MPKPLDDTIAALSSPPGRGGRAIVRLSGPDALPILRSLCPGHGLPSEKDRPYAARPVRVAMDGDGRSVAATAYVMGAPKSYTRQTVVELHVVGAPALAEAVLESCFRAGARPAEPGEFTRRAFLNGRIDLSQAEAVNKLIRARDDGARRAAVLEMGGEIARHVEDLSGKLASALAWIESRIDFVDQEIGPPEDGPVLDLLDRAALRLDAILGEAASDPPAGKALVVLAGLANAGKSSLFNALTGGENALVSDIAGTTRDVVTADGEGRGTPYTLADPAGLYGESGRVGEEARRKFEVYRRAADLVVWVLDGSRPPGPAEMSPAREASPASIAVLSKADLPLAWNREDLEKWASDAIAVSVATGQGMERLKEQIESRLARTAVTAEGFGWNARQRSALKRAGDRVAAARAAFTSGTEEIASLEVREALDDLGRLTGRALDEEVLGRIFSEFCVGK